MISKSPCEQSSDLPAFEAVIGLLDANKGYSVA
jgi:hypothetical protein